MLIQPDSNQPSVSNMVELIRTNGKRYVDIIFQDSEGNPKDIDESMLGGEAVGQLDLEITDIGGNVIYNEVYWPKPSPDTRRITHPATGKYGLTYGTVSTETGDVETQLANWHLRENTESEDVYATQVLEVVSPRTLSILPKLRFMVDKTVKPCFPEEYCFLGFTDAQLIAGLQMGLHMMNEYQPYPCWTNIDAYDINRFGTVLIRSAMFQLVTSQAIFAIDTDIPSYNDQGHSFVVQHFPQLMQVANTLKTELDRSIPDVKRHHVSNGSLGAEIAMNATAYLMFQSMPGGSIYRNWWARV